MEHNMKTDNNSQRKRRPRKRRRNRNRNRKQKEESEVKETQQTFSHNLTDLITEANALEKQLNELQTQLKINYMNIPSKEQGRRAGAIAIEQIAATEEEMSYVRNSLKKTYRHIVSTDLMYATTHHIEDKIWRHILYAEIESVRNKLRKIKPDDPSYSTLQKTFFQKVHSAFKFYRDLNHNVKATYHIDTKVLGIDLFKKISSDDKVGTLLQSNYICMGDLARYQAQQAMFMKSKSADEYWSIAKSCYLKSIDVYRMTGKPYSQLALVSISNGNAMDVVWYYCMSLAMKYPSSVGKDNLKSFYSKVRLSSKPKEITKNTSEISQFVESFLYVHRTVMFGGKESEDFSTITPITIYLASALSGIIKNVLEEEDAISISKSTTSLLHILRTTITRTVTILLISIWITTEKMKNKANYDHRATLLSSQLYMYIFVFQLFAHVCKYARDALHEIKDNLSVDKYNKLDIMVEESILPGLGIWCTYIYTNMTPITQYCMTAATDTRNREPEKKILVKAIQSLLSILISHSSFPDPVLNVLPPTYPVSEDITLLGVVPLIDFHTKVDFFKENGYESLENSPEARKQVRWGRIRDMIKKMADSSSLEFIQYNQNEQRYSIIDENAKRQQQNRFMKALATQRLMEEVSSLEKNVNRLSFNGKNLGNRVNDEPVKKDVYTCVVDVTAFLDGLDKVKRWSNQTLNVDSRRQGSILE
ncbi:hypothetical protein BDB01DRAFT_30109 [Pilobolus umbonatus]|nr:hypothetical protein BDB01DRAFT_30109 [Pilobolus umbonatus]